MRRLTPLPLVPRFLATVLLALALVATVLACDPAAVEPDGGTGRDASGPCAADLDCSDGMFCNGPERCDPEDPGADAQGCVLDAEPCESAELCDEELDRCLGACGTEDADRDGEPSVGCGGLDCDDTDPLRYSAAIEICDDVDQDCDPLSFGTVDADADGYLAARCCNPQADGSRLCGPDCDDSRADVSPMAVELCNMRDDDCDGAVDENANLQCTIFGAASARCDTGACVIDTCESGRADCDGLDSTGCEALLGSLEHCASCGDLCTASGGTAICSMGVCGVDSCSAGLHTCGGACVEDDAIATCGSRCEPCVDPENGSPACTGSPGAYACAIVCDPGYAQVGDTCAPIPAPRPIAPLSGSVLTSRRPRVTVALPAGADGFEVDLCSDRSCATIVETFSFVGTEGVLAPGATDLSEGRLYFWRTRGASGGVPGTATGPVWQFWTRREAFLRDTAIGVAPDYDGDGLSDLAIATAMGLRLARGSSASTPFGAPTTISSTTTTAAAHAIGDVDGDGHVDLLEHVGTACNLWRGAPTGLTGGAAVAGITGCRLALALGDVDRDGYGDVAVVSGTQVEILLGSSAGLELDGRYPADPVSAAVRFAFAAGDFDGDGFGDLARYREATGRTGAAIVVRRGSATGLGAAGIWLPPRGSVPTGVAPAGDLNRDGLSDVLIRTETTGTITSRHVRAVLGGGTVLGPVMTSIVTTPQPASTLVGVIDVLGTASGPDGFDDVLFDNGTSLLLYRGGAVALDTAMPGTIASRPLGTGLGPVGTTAMGALAVWTASGTSVEVHQSNRGALTGSPVQTIAAGSTVRGVAGAQP